MLALLQQLALAVVGLLLYLVAFWPTHTKVVILGIAGLVLAVVTVLLLVLGDDRFNFKR